MPQTKVRVVGSGFTTFEYNGQAMGLLDSVNDAGQQPVGQGNSMGGSGAGWEAILPLGKKHPIEIATGRVLAAGTLVASIREVWEGEVWQGLAGLGKAYDLIDVWEILARDQQTVTCKMVIKTPPGVPNRKKVYHNCVITAIDTGENIQVGSLSVAKNVTIAYTHVTGGDVAGKNGNAGNG